MDDHVGPRACGGRRGGIEHVGTVSFHSRGKIRNELWVTGHGSDRVTVRGRGSGDGVTDAPAPSTT